MCDLPPSLQPHLHRTLQYPHCIITVSMLNPFDSQTATLGNDRLTFFPAQVTFTLPSSCPSYLNLPSGSVERPVLLCMDDIPSRKESEDTDHLISPTEAAPVGAAQEQRGKTQISGSSKLTLIHLPLYQVVLAATRQPLVNLHG
ncbi:hypothetical protein NQZ68_001524 [Dissostichus eleginoides]|nr:hypothetical protein NQZ68_001524 [Dissostichus eleginoides]